MSDHASGPKAPKKNKKEKKSSTEEKIVPSPKTGETLSSDPSADLSPEIPQSGAKKIRWVDHPTFGFDLDSAILRLIESSSASESPPGKKGASKGNASDREGGGTPSESASAPRRSKLQGRCAVIFSPESLEPWAHHQLKPWMIQRIRLKKNEWTLWTLDQGPLWVLFLDLQAISRHTQNTDSPAPSSKPPQGQTAPTDSSPYGLGREMGAQLVATIQDYHLLELAFEWVGHESLPKTAVQNLLDGIFSGLELGSYRFKTTFQGPLAPLPRISLPERPKWDAAGPLNLALATNLARHLVNLPPNVLYPESYGEMIQGLFAESPHMNVEIWDHKRLQKERCQLICAVGGASQYPPALIHLRYRPQVKSHLRHETQGKNQQGSTGVSPVVFVAKGITFDSGGLNIKDSGSMRLMKKDMGGSASALGIAYWLDRSGLPLPCDFYLALAENAIGSRSFRPGDIVSSRSGITVEIDNTDAEGRLVLADALDVALEHHPQMKLLINFATLTGAMRVALGTRVAGYFTTAQAMVPTLEKAALNSGEPLWQMPLYPEYRNHLKSYVADLANSGPQRFGGAISAALFLQRFVGTHPWLHIDHYAWNEGAGAGANEPGGSGQLVQLFAHFLQELVTSSASGPSGKS
jgi:leucyl aminopeptidase